MLLLAAALARPSVAAAMFANWMIVGALVALAVFVGVVALLARNQGRSVLLWVGLSAAAGVLLIAGLITMLSTVFRHGDETIGEEEAPVAAVLLMDTAPRMSYRHHNQSRLEKSQEIADWLLTQLPPGSDIAIADTNLGASVFAVDSGAARKTLSGLLIDAASRPIPDVLLDALDLLAESQLQRRELYIFTDLAERAWPEEAAGILSGRMDDVENLSVYLIDVGVESPNNFALGDVDLVKQLLPRNGTLDVGVSLLDVGIGGERVVELEVEQYQPELPIIVDGKPKLPDIDPAKRRRQTVNLAAGGSAAVQFSVAGLEVGTHHGRIRLDRTDGLVIDDERYFTFEVREPWPVLIAHGPDARGELLEQAIAPYEFVVTDQTRFRPKVISTEELGRLDLKDYSIVCLLDPPPLVASQWQQLAAYAQQGGNVAIFLGHNASKSNFNDAPAQELLPGKLDRQWRSGVRPGDFDGRADLYLSPQVLAHPLLAAFREIAANVPWADFPVFRHWSFAGSKLKEGAAVVMRYSNGQPAMVLRELGQGRVLVMTTPISDPSRPAGREPWNWLPTGFEPWPYVMLANETMLYLAGSGDTQLNYFAGQAAEIRLPETDEEEAYLLFTPGGTRPQTVRPDDGALRLPFTSVPGNYRLKATVREALLGFSVNLPLQASDMTRAEKPRLDALLGEGDYKLAREREEIVREQGEQRVGRELFPTLVLLLVVVLGLEAVLSNRFYRKE